MLVQQGLVKALSGKQLEGMNATDWKDSETRLRWLSRCSWSMR